MFLELRRIILFTSNLDALGLFYRQVLGLPLLNKEKGWIELHAGPCTLALHQGAATPGQRPPKLVFFAGDVSAARDLLIQRGARGMGKVLAAGAFEMCNGKDPDGNPFQISSRD